MIYNQSSRYLGGYQAVMTWIRIRMAHVDGWKNRLDKIFAVSMQVIIIIILSHSG